MSDNDKPDHDPVEWVIFLSIYFVIGYLILAHKILWTLQVISIFD